MVVSASSAHLDFSPVRENTHTSGTGRTCDHDDDRSEALAEEDGCTDVESTQRLRSRAKKGKESACGLSPQAHERVYEATHLQEEHSESDSLDVVEHAEVQPERRR